MRLLSLSIRHWSSFSSATDTIRGYIRAYSGSRDSSALGYGLNDRVFESRQGLESFLSTTASRPALGPTQSPIQWLSGAVSLGIERPESDAEHSPPSSAEVKECVELYLHSPTSLHGVVLS
jgi:hypothetical protein